MSTSSANPTIFHQIPNLWCYFGLDRSTVAGPTPLPLNQWEYLAGDQQELPVFKADDRRIYKAYHSASFSAFSARFWKVATSVAVIATAVFAISAYTGIVAVTTPVSISIIAALGIASLICLNKAKSASKNEELAQKYSEVNERLLEFTDVQLRTSRNVFRHFLYNNILKDLQRDQLQKIREELTKQVEEEIDFLKRRTVTIDQQSFNNDLDTFFCADTLAKSKRAFDEFSSILRKLNVDISLFRDPKLARVIAMKKSGNDHQANTLFRESYLSGELPNVHGFLESITGIARNQMKIQIIDEIDEMTHDRAGIELRLGVLPGVINLVVNPRQLGH